MRAEGTTVSSLVDELAGRTSKETPWWAFCLLNNRASGIGGTGAGGTRCADSVISCLVDVQGGGPRDTPTLSRMENTGRPIPVHHGVLPISMKISIQPTVGLLSTLQTFSSSHSVHYFCLPFCTTSAPTSRGYLPLCRVATRNITCHSGEGAGSRAICHGEIWNFAGSILWLSVQVSTRLRC